MRVVLLCEASAYNFGRRRSGWKDKRKKAGATRDEVKGAILVTLMTNGINGVADALALALDSYDNTPV